MIVVGVSYKAGVQDLRESPALPIIAGLIRQGADVHYYDPLVPDIRLGDGRLMSSELAPGEDWDLTLIHTLHPGVDYTWAEDSALYLMRVPVRRRSSPRGRLMPSEHALSPLHAVCQPRYPHPGSIARRGGRQ